MCVNKAKPMLPTAHTPIKIMTVVKLRFSFTAQHKFYLPSKLWEGKQALVWNTDDRGWVRRRLPMTCGDVAAGATLEL